MHHVLPTDLPEPFFYAENIKAVHEFFSTCTAANDGLPETPSELNGNCFICNEPVAFTVDIPEDGGPVNWRETLICPQCGLINRWRGCLHVFAALFEPTRFDRIYLTETLSPVYQNLASRFPLLSGSEFFPDLPSGEMVPTHTMAVRNEDVTSLTFADSSLEAVLCFDVLEHVPDYRSALREFYRVLGSGGQLLISVPFSFEQETRVRAMLDDAGNIKHLMEPCYHGDPLSDQGVLSYYDFGMELLEEMREAGFQECFLLCYSSKKWGYFDHNVAFVGRKLRTAVRARKSAKPAIQDSQPDIHQDSCDRLLNAAKIKRHTEKEIRTAYPNGHFYSPVVDPADLLSKASGIWSQAAPQIPGIDFNDAAHEMVLENWFPRHISKYDYAEVLNEQGHDEKQFYTQNSQFSWLDSRALFVFLNEIKPARMIEVGSGYSSLLTADVNLRLLDNSCIFQCIEPYPRDFLVTGVAGMSELITQQVQDVPPGDFEILEKGDILFIDSSHVCKTGSDVNYLYFEVLPRLKPGVLIHVHDIFLPFEYPQQWVLEENRSWNEQYLLRALLMYSDSFQVFFGCQYAFSKFPELLIRALDLQSGASFGGGSFWFTKV